MYSFCPPEPEKELKFLTPDKIKQKVNDVMGIIPGKEETVQLAQEKCEEFMGNCGSYREVACK